MAFDVNGAIGQLKNPIICNCCCTIKGEVSAREARIDELVLAHDDGKIACGQGYAQYLLVL
uniref:Uncharacterized protein n=1 Tax=Oryza barthii TaxID=65489 RepID=A0A0D3GLY5_9ORYZ